MAVNFQGISFYITQPLLIMQVKQEQKQINFNQINNQFLYYFIKQKLSHLSLMNKSGSRLKTIETQQVSKPGITRVDAQQLKKAKKESSRKISLKQSSLKQNKDTFIQEWAPKSKKSQQIIIEDDHKYKIIKQIQDSSKEDHKKSHKFSNYSKNNKSLIFSDHKFSNSHQTSTLKGSKIFTSDNKPTANKQKQVYYNPKKVSQKASTTKKHSKSVYNYTQFDDYHDMKSDIKKQASKQHQTKKDRQYHNRSLFTQPNQISTSSITKRASKSKQILKKMLNNSDIKKKTSHFKILSNCLRTYVEAQELSQSKIDSSQIVKLVQAFNKAEISKMSKPLEELISEMMSLIQQTLKKQRNQTQQTKLRPTFQTYQTPQRPQSRQNFRSSSGKDKFYGQQSLLNPNDISKTKKFTLDDYEAVEKGNDSFSESKAKQILKQDVQRMQEGLQQLRKESKQMKKIIEASGKKQKLQKSQIEQKKSQIDKLRQIIERQQMILQKIETLTDSEKDQQASSNSSLKYEPEQE